jgi:serine/threonine protein phosphatase PrpC
MDLPFEIAGGSVQGSAHALAGRNNQDAFCWARSGASLVAVVCDGCSSAPHSEVGAALGSRLLVQSIAARLGTQRSPEARLEAARADVVARLRSLAAAMSIDGTSTAPGGATHFGQTVADHFLFTVVGALVHDGTATTFSLGDGLAVVNGERALLGPFPNNEPPYLGYALLDDGTPCPAFTLGRSLPAAELETLLLGTDGLIDLEALAERPLTAERDVVGPLRQFWEEDRFFRNADMVRRRLTIIARGAGRETRGRLLSDDTTLVAIRRRRPDGGAS